MRRLYIGKDEEELPEGLAEPCMRLEKYVHMCMLFEHCFYWVTDEL